MLREFVYVKQERHGGRRRWFESDGLELVVWQDTAGRLEGFQLCYDLGQGEHALTWRPGAGFCHSVVDSGDSLEGAAGKQTPILVPDGPVPWAELEARFAQQSGTIEPQLRELVSTRLAVRQ